jgi:hypothetical protein
MNGRAGGNAIVINEQASGTARSIRHQPWVVAAVAMNNAVKF